MNEWNSRAVSLNITSHPAYTRTGPGTHTRRAPPAHARSLKHKEGPSTHTIGLDWPWEVPESKELGSTGPRSTGNCQWSSQGRDAGMRA